ncbi:MAG: hypothetical protein CMF52_05890 [Legionellales bacterium]|nr:hypothetical protein [Legionellales bacterium]
MEDRLPSSNRFGCSVEYSDVFKGVFLCIWLGKEEKNVHIPTLVKCAVAVLSGMLVTLNAKCSEVINITKPRTRSSSNALYFYFQLFPTDLTAIPAESINTAVRFIQATYNKVCGLKIQQETEILKDISQTFPRLFSIIRDGVEYYARLPPETKEVARETVLEMANVQKILKQKFTIEKLKSSDEVGQTIEVKYGDTLFVNEV